MQHDRTNQPARVATLVSALGTTLCIGLAASAQAQNYPVKPITLVAPFAPGGNIDLTARALAQPLGALLGQAVVVENRPGAGGMVGAAAVARAKPDGYTLLLGHSGTHATVPAVFKTISYDPGKDFVALGGVTITPSVLVTGAQLPAMNFAQFRDYSAKHPPGVSIASAGTGSFNHLTIELLKYRLNLQSVHIPYKGSAPAITDLLGGQVQAMIDQLSTSLPYIRDGKFRAVAQLGKTRSPLLPDVPTLAEQGFPNVDAAVYTAVFAPAGVPKEIINKLTLALSQVLKDPALIARYRDMGAESMDMTQAEFARFVKDEAQKWKSLAQEAKISIEQ